MDMKSMRESCISCPSCGASTALSHEDSATYVKNWNRRAPDPMTSVVKWTRCNRDNPVFPEIGKRIVYSADKYIDERTDKIIRVVGYTEDLFDPWMRFGRTVVWAPLPTPPEGME